MEMLLEFFVFECSAWLCVCVSLSLFVSPCLVFRFWFAFIFIVWQASMLEFSMSKWSYVRSFTFMCKSAFYENDGIAFNDMAFSLVHRIIYQHNIYLTVIHCGPIRTQWNRTASAHNRYLLKIEIEKTKTITEREREKKNKNIALFSVSYDAIYVCALNQIHSIIGWPQSAFCSLSLSLRLLFCVQNENGK